MKCSQCGTEFEGKFCPNCGAKAEAESSVELPPVRQLSASSVKKKKPFLLKWWFILCVVAVIGVIAVSLEIGRNEERENEERGNEDEIRWLDMELGDILPEPPSDIGTTYENSDEELWVSLNQISDKQYNDYFDACVEKGFDIDADKSSVSYQAYNSEGYCLDISHIVDDLDIHLTAPKEFGDITWPIGTAGKLLPIPKSTTGKFSYERDDSFFVYVSDTSKEDYDEYVKACSDKGFVLDYNKGEDYYRADNADGWKLALTYEGNHVMSIRISPSSKNETNILSDGETGQDANETSGEIEPEESAENGNSVSSVEKPEDDVIAASEAAESEEVKEDDGVIGSDFKAAMDSYEAFMDEYVAFIKKYNENPSDMQMLNDYAVYMNKYADFVADFEKWNNEELNAAETAYYIDVQARVSKKLLEAAQ